MEVRSDASSPGDAERESTVTAPFAMVAAMHCHQCSQKFTMHSRLYGITADCTADCTGSPEGRVSGRASWEGIREGLGGPPGGLGRPQGTRGPEPMPAKTVGFVCKLLWCRF